MTQHKLSNNYKTFDQQIKTLPKDIIFCKNCVVSNQRPRTAFNEKGICSACEWSYEKDHVVNWQEREKQLAELCDKHRSKDGSYDVIVPSSGGKDSAFVAHQLRDRWGMHPLCVTWAPFEWTPTGWKNLMAFNRAGFSNIIAQPNANIHRKLAKAAFLLLGDAWQPFAYGQKSWAFHIAEKFGVKLIFYGENGELEYGGSTQYKNTPKENIESFAEQYYKGTSVDLLAEYALTENILTKNEINIFDLDWYKLPHPDILLQKQIEMHWYSYYSKWTPHENYFYAAKYTGFEANESGRTECTYTKYASIDDKADGFHFYLGYMKFGLGRASRDAMQDIRRHHLTREEGVSLVHLYDHEFPSKYYSWFLEYLGISEEFFWDVMDYYRSNSNAWVKEYGKWQLKQIVR